MIGVNLNKNYLGVFSLLYHGTSKATFNNISVISWQPVVLVQIEVAEENHNLHPFK